MKNNFPQLVGEKKKDENSGKEKSGQWCICQAGGKRTEGMEDVKEGKLHVMFASAPDLTLMADFSKIGDGYEF